jgi:hypothetical protein
LLACENLCEEKGQVRECILGVNKTHGK